MSTETLAFGPKKGHEHTHTVIFLHDEEGDCEEFGPEFFVTEVSGPADQPPRLLLDRFPTIRWVLPAAPVTHSAHFSNTDFQWFDVWSSEHRHEPLEVQVDGLKESVAFIEDIVKQEEALVPCDKIFLGGMSQGFATAYSVYSLGSNVYAGLIGLCSWEPWVALSVIMCNEDHTRYTKPQGRRPIPVFLGHSKNDSVVPIEEGRALRDALKSRREFDLEWHEYEDGGHWINEPQGVDDMVAFLDKHMNGVEKKV